MAIRWRTFLDDLLLDTEPVNMSTIQLSVVRDEELHGVGAEASTDALQFVGNGAEYLESIMETQGLKANVVFRAEKSCGPDQAYEVMIEGKLDFTDYKRKEGLECNVSVPIETITCETLLKSRIDQAVNMDKGTAFDDMTALNSYDDFNFPVTLPTRELPYKTEGYVREDDEPLVIGPTMTGATVFITRPNYANEVAANIHQSQLSGASILAFENTGVISPNVLWDERNVNFPNAILVSGRLKGRVVNIGAPASGIVGWVVVFRGEMTPGDFNFGQFPSSNYESIAVDQIIDTGDLFTTIEFDLPYNYVWNPVDSGADGLYAGLAFGGGSGVTYKIIFDPETFFKAETVKAVPPSVSNGYMIHETLSRAVEAITNGCAKVKSQYYGRIDSQPFAFPVDGCGGLRMVTSGLKLRNAQNPVFAPSFQKLIRGLRAIDNIGMGMEINTEPGGGYIVRVEDLDYFYQDVEILRCPRIPQLDTDVYPAKAYAKIKIGYKKWQTQTNFGLDEFNSDREYRTSLTVVSNTLDVTSELVAGEYAIELTREQQAVDTSDADTTYDDETFIVCMTRLAGYGYAYGGLVVEQGGIDLPNNIFSPNTVYNYRISPARNMLRWFRSVAASYPNISDADNKIFFSTGTGNILASGKLRDSYLNECVLENVPIGENQGLQATQFKDITRATPLWKCHVVNFDYPMSIADYNLLKSNPYGYISYQKANGDWDKGFIKELKYSPVQGMCTFNLLRKWQ